MVLPERWFRLGPPVQVVHIVVAELAIVALHPNHAEGFIRNSANKQTILKLFCKETFATFQKSFETFESFQKSFEIFETFLQILQRSTRFWNFFEKFQRNFETFLFVLYVWVSLLPCSPIMQRVLSEILWRSTRFWNFFAKKLLKLFCKFCKAHNFETFCIETFETFQKSFETFETFLQIPQRSTQFWNFFAKKLLKLFKKVLKLFCKFCKEAHDFETFLQRNFWNFSRKFWNFWNFFCKFCKEEHDFETFLKSFKETLKLFYLYYMFEFHCCPVPQSCRGFIRNSANNQTMRWEHLSLL